MNFLVFPGQASQYPGMGKDWYENFEAAKRVFEEASDFSGLKLKKLCFEGSDADLRSTEITQPAILTTCVAIWRSLAQLCDTEKLSNEAIFAGHSLGEYTALIAAGAMELGPVVKFVNQRGRAMQEAVPEGEGGMLALIFKPKSENTVEASQEICDKAQKMSDRKAWIANINGAQQIVLAGHAEAMRCAQIVAMESDLPVRQALALDVSAPFHCPLMEPAAEKLQGSIEAFRFQGRASRRYISNVDAEIHSLDGDFDSVKKRLLDQICSPVLWWQSAQKALEQGCENVLEVGPKKVLSGMTRRIDWNEKTFRAFNVDRREDWENVKAVLGT